VLLQNVSNLSDFLGCPVFDKMVRNADARQSIFFSRPAARLDGGGIRILKLGFVALMIDTDRLQRSDWDFPTLRDGSLLRKLVYENIRSIDDFQPG